MSTDAKETPRTDAAVKRIVLENEDSCCAIYVMRDGIEYDDGLVASCDMAQLERELAEAREEVERLKSSAGQVFLQAGRVERDQLREENTHLRARVQAAEGLAEALIDARASFLGLQPDFGGPVAAQMGAAIQRINAALAAFRATEGRRA